MLTPEQQRRYDPSAVGGNKFPPDSRQGDPFAAEQRAVNDELTTLRQQLAKSVSARQCLVALLAAVRDGSNAHAANLTRMARENVELHTTLVRYKAALTSARTVLMDYRDDLGEWIYPPNSIFGRRHRATFDAVKAIDAALGNEPKDEKG